MKLRSMLVLAFALFCAPAFAQVNPGTTPLTGAKGGTNNAFMQFTGPATAMKTYTLANASDTIALLGQVQTWTGAQTFNDGTVILLGSSLATAVAAPSAPSAGSVKWWFDSTALRFHDISSTGVIGTTVVADTGAANNFLTGINALGGITKAQPSLSNLSGWGTGVLTAAGNTLNAASGLVGFSGALGTPTSGVATNLTGTAAGLTAGNVTTNANLTGPVTSVGNATTIGVNQVARNNLAQGLGLSVIGNATSSAANDGDIAGTANQALVVNPGGTALGFGAVNLASAAAVTGILPVANGGTGNAGTAYTTYTPTMACLTGSGTWSVTNKGRYQQTGKEVHFVIELTLTTANTCATSFTFTLPFTAASPLTMLVRETGVTGNAYQGYAATSATVGTVIGLTNNAITFANGDIFIASGVYESQ
jgi:hypothetical protein